MLIAKSWPAMSKSQSDATVTKSPIDSYFGSEEEPLYPAVRYGTADNTQKPELRRLNEMVPPDATTVSPIYMLTEGQLDRQQQLSSPYAVADVSCIAKEIQDECEQKDRVLYPVYVESDEHERGKPLPTIAIEIAEFVEERLELSDTELKRYYSGYRSIHGHLPVFLTSKEDLDRLKQLATQFNAERDSELDTGIYERKRQFRLPGVEHEKTGFSKIPIGSEWSQDEIVKAAKGATNHVPSTYLDFLTNHHPTTRYIARTAMQPPDRIDHHGRYYLNNILSHDEAVLELNEGEELNVPIPVVEREFKPDTDPERARWKQYNRHPFSPYANADADSTRSVAIIRVQNGAFGCQSEKGQIFLPCYIHAAVGGDGEFDIQEEYGPVLLSKPDYEGREFISGQRLAILGGRSRNSRIIEIGPAIASSVADVLREEGRRAAIKALHNCGSDVGQSGPSVSEYPRGSAGESARHPQSSAQRLQKKAESDGIDRLSWEDQRNVANCLLQKHGWDRTWRWFREQYGDNFDPEITHRQLETIVRYFDDIHIPPPSLSYCREID